MSGFSYEELQDYLDRFEPVLEDDRYEQLSGELERRERGGEIEEEYGARLLTELIETATEDLAEYAGRISTVEEALRKSLTAQGSLQDQYEDLSDEVGSIEEQIEGLDYPEAEEIEDLRDDIAELREDARGNSADIDQVRSRTEEVADLYRDLESEIDDLQALPGELDSQTSELDARIEELEDWREDLNLPETDRIEDLEEELSDLNDQVDDHGLRLEEHEDLLEEDEEDLEEPDNDEQDRPSDTLEWLGGVAFGDYGLEDFTLGLKGERRGP